MSKRVQIHEIDPLATYAVGWYEGPTYSGPGGGYLFWEGQVPNKVPGHMANKNGLPLIGVFFLYDEAKALRWDGSEWLYEKAAVPQPVERVAPPPKPAKPAPKADVPKAEKKPVTKRRGRPKGSKNKAKK